MVEIGKQVLQEKGGDISEARYVENVLGKKYDWHIYSVVIINYYHHGIFNDIVSTWAYTYPKQTSKTEFEI